MHPGGTVRWRELDAIGRALAGVALAPIAGMQAFQHILVPTDFSSAAEKALDLALELAPKFSAKITLLHAPWLPPAYYSAYAEGLTWPTAELEGLARKELEATYTKAKERYSNIEAVLVPGDPWERIIEGAKAHHVDLIVMGTHGRRGISRVLLGSVAEKVVRLSPVPVLTVSAEAERRESDATSAKPNARQPA